MKKLFVLSVALSLLVTGCKKESGTGSGGGVVTCTLSKTTLPGIYVVTAETSQTDAQATPVDEFSGYDACEKDDLLTIKNDGTLTFTEGPVSCDPPNDPFSINWILNGNNFILTDGTVEIGTTISDFTCKSFKLKYVDPTDQSITITTYTRK